MLPELFEVLFWFSCAEKNVLNFTGCFNNPLKGKEGLFESTKTETLSMLYSINV